MRLSTHLLIHVIQAPFPYTLVGGRWVASVATGPGAEAQFSEIHVEQGGLLHPASHYLDYLRFIVEFGEAPRLPQEFVI